MSKTKKEGKKKEVLADHQRRGKTFVPPLTAQIGPLKEVSWIKRILPETLWISLLHQLEGLRKGVRLAESLAEGARSINQSVGFFGSISSYARLSTEEFEVLRSWLAARGTLFDLQKALFPLVSLYPNCPLRHLYSVSSDEVAQLTVVKSLVAKLYDRESREAVFTLSTFIYLAFQSGILRVKEGLILADFPQVEDYPKTERSREVASMIRATSSSLFGEPLYDESSPWPKYFWNRGLELENCSFASGEGDKGDREPDAHS